MVKKDVEFVRENNLIKEIVVVDGIGRSGKVFINGVIAAMERVEKQNNSEFMEYVPFMHSLGKIKTDAAIAILRTMADTCLNNQMIFRDVNLRFQDYTGLYKNPFRWKYIKRLFQGDHKDVIRRVNKERPIFHIHVHDGLRTAKLLFQAFDKRLKMIYMVRDPVDLVYEWIRSDFGSRIGSDPTEFQYTIKHKNSVVPYTAIGWEDEYIKISPAERVVVLIYNHFKKNMDAFTKLTPYQKKKVLFISFEEIVTNPAPYVRKMSKFLGVKPTSKVKKVLRREGAPRKLLKEERDRRINNVLNSVSPKYQKLFKELIKLFESKYWLK